MADVRTPIFEALRALDIPYELFEHPPVFNSGDAAAHWRQIDGTPVKNLFLRNKKGDRHYLIVLGIEKQADLRTLVKIVGDDRLSFGSPERLMKYLGVTPGSVSPLGLIFDATKTVRVVVDSDLRGARRLILHPNDNTASLTIDGPDLERFLDRQGHVVRWIKL